MSAAERGLVPAVEDERLRVLIVDDHRLFADAVSAALTARGYDVAGIAGTADEALRMADDLVPDLALVDLGLPDRSGLELGSELLEAHPSLVLLALTALESPRAVEDALRLGFRGYLSKDTPVDAFVRAIGSALDDQTVVPSALMRTVAGDARDADLLASQLTRREIEVLRALVEGLPGATIARRLAISPNTVRTHIQSILTKLQVHSRLEAATFAVRHGIVEVPRPAREVVRAT